MGNHNRKWSKSLSSLTNLPGKDAVNCNGRENEYDNPASLILVVGTSLEVLRFYKFLWPAGLEGVEWVGRNGTTRKSRTSLATISNDGGNVGAPQVKRSRRSSLRGNRSSEHQCELAIVNLSDTCRDGLASVRINERCDDVFREVMEGLGLEVPAYNSAEDPLRALAVPIVEDEKNTRARPDLVFDS